MSGPSLEPQELQEVFLESRKHCKARVAELKDLHLNSMLAREWLGHLNQVQLSAFLGSFDRWMGSPWIK